MAPNIIINPSLSISVKRDHDLECRRCGDRSAEKCIPKVTEHKSVSETLNYINSLEH